MGRQSYLMFLFNVLVQFGHWTLACQRTCLPARSRSGGGRFGEQVRYWTSDKHFAQVQIQI